MTFNIHHGAGIDGVLDLNRIAALIDDYDIDIVGLQEVDRFWSRSAYVDQPAWLSRRLRMHMAFGANLDLDPEEEGRPRRQYGTAVLSRFPIINQRNTFLPRHEDHEQRGLLQTQIRVPGAAVAFACTHLAYETLEERRDQCESITGLLRRHSGRTILTGDLNTTPDSPELDPLTEILSDSWQGADDGFTYPVEDPSKRIDFLWHGNAFTPRSSTVVVSAPHISDHLPVITEYSMRR